MRAVPVFSRLPRARGLRRLPVRTTGGTADGCDCQSCHDESNPPGHRLSHLGRKTHGRDRSAPERHGRCHRDAENVLHRTVGVRFGNILLYYRPGNKRRHVSPDVMVVRGLEQRDRENYLLWEEGRAPNVVIEVTSQSTRDEDLEDKLEIYRDEIGVAEYFLFDPRSEYLNPALQGHRLDAAGTCRSCPSPGGCPARNWGCTWKPTAAGCGSTIRRTSAGCRRPRKHAWKHSRPGTEGRRPEAIRSGGGAVTAGVDRIAAAAVAGAWACTDQPEYQRRFAWPGRHWTGGGCGMVRTASCHPARIILWKRRGGKDRREREGDLTTVT